MARLDDNMARDLALDFGISQEEFAEYLTYKKERDKAVPKVGTEAPDFEVEMLTSDGARTGETFRLSSSKGKPMALLMGSYT